jgi:3'-5' exoribonuclease
MPAVCWEQAESFHDVACPGAAIRVKGHYAIDQRYGPQLTVQELSAAVEGDYELVHLVEGPPMDVSQMEADLRTLIETVRNPHLRILLDALFGERADVWRRFRAAPAAKFYHQAYSHGLLEHTLLVAQAVSAISASFPGVDRDLAVAAALIHDIGKIEAYALDPACIDLTDDGRLHGEIPLGYYLVRRTIETIEDFDAELAKAVLHIVLSHHGKLENGSPVVPATREATLVHAMDNLGGNLGSFDRIERELPDGEAWSRFDRGIDSAAYFRSRRAA